MKMGLVLLTSICFLSLLHQPAISVKWRPRRVKGLLLFSKNKCEERCKVKHGYFLDKEGGIRDASVAKRYLLKCQCMVSKELKEFITSKFGAKAAKSYSRFNFFGYTGKARAKLEQAALTTGKEPIQFLKHALLAEEVKKQQKAAEAKRSQLGHQEQHQQQHATDTGGSMSTFTKEELTPGILEQLLQIKAREEGKANASPPSSTNGHAQMTKDFMKMAVKLSPEESKEFERLIKEQKAQKTA